MNTEEKLLREALRRIAKLEQDVAALKRPAPPREAPPASVVPAPVDPAEPPQ